MLERKAFQQTLPQKRISAGCLFFDKQNRLLVVNPTYKETWEIPGGVVEQNESPLNAVQREVFEELGLSVKPKRLLCIDYSAETDSRTESLQFIFLGPPLTKEMISAIKLPEEELSEFRIIKPKKGIKLLNRSLRHRVKKCLRAIERRETLYLEEQQLVK